MCDDLLLSKQSYFLFMCIIEVFSLIARAVVYRASLVNSSPPANDEAANNYLAGVQPDSTHQVDMSMILEQSVIDHSPPRSLTSFLPAGLFMNIQAMIRHVTNLV